MKRSGFARCSLLQLLGLSALILPLAHSALAVSTLPCPSIGAQPPSPLHRRLGLDTMVSR